MPRRTAQILLCATATGLALPGPASAATFDLVTSWGSSGSGDGQFLHLNDVTVAGSGDVYTIEDGGGASNRVQRFDANGAFLGKAGSEGNGTGQFRDGVSLSAGGSQLFVIDGFSHRVTVMDPASLAVQGTWGSAGTGAGQFSNPEGIAALATGEVYVADRGNNQVDEYTASGGAVTSWGGSGATPGLFNRIVEVAVSDGLGDVYAVDRDNDRVQRFTPSGVFVRAYGLGQGTGPGQLQAPQDVAVDTSGNVWVADTPNFRIQEFAADGTFLASYDKAGGLGLAAVGLAFGPGGDLYVADANENILRVHPSRGSGALPPPVLGKSVNVAPASGKVFVSVRAGSAFASLAVLGIKGRTFVPLTEARQIPVGSFLDTRKGTVSLTSASTKSGKVFAGTFSAGVFTALQARSGLTDLTLKGSSFRSCTRQAGKRASAALSKRAIRRMRGKAKGRFRTRGRYSAAIVRGTEWDTIDRCDGTLTKVKRGVVVVRDNRKHRNITVRAGKSYLARAPG